jgi:hypothetical protein
MGRYREVDLQGNSGVDIGFDGGHGLAGEPCHLTQRTALRGSEKTLKLELALDEPGVVQLLFQVGSEIGIVECSRHPAG